MRRRDFLARLAGGVAPGVLGRGGTAFAEITRKLPAERPNLKLQRIAISTWSLRNYFRTTRASDFDLPGPMLALLDFPGLMADKYKVRHFEFSAAHFPSTESSYLLEVKYTLSYALAAVVNIPVDIEECGPAGTFSDPDPGKRTAALETVKSWVDVAHAIGARCVRVGPGKVDAGNLAIASEAYRKLAAYALPKGVQVMVENQPNFGAAHPAELEKLLRLAGHGSLGALPDLANFPDEATRREGLELLFPYAHNLCHAKSLQFDSAGTEMSYDFPQALAIAKKARFQGLYSIEFDGPGDPYAGIQKTLDELLKYL